MFRKLLLTIVLFYSMSLPVYGAIGIPQYLMPGDTPLRQLNVSIEKNAQTSHDAAVVGANQLLQFIANALLYVAAPLAVLFIAHGGSNYAFAFGEQGKLDGAKREILWSLLGLGTILVAYIAVRLVISSFLGFDASGSINNGTTTPPAQVEQQGGDKFLQANPSTLTSPPKSEPNKQGGNFLDANPSTLPSPEHQTDTNPPQDPNASPQAAT